MSILVFPCGSEIGLEIFRSLPFLPLVGASSVADYGRVLYEDRQYLPYIHDSSFGRKLDELIATIGISAICPANDAAILFFAENPGYPVIGSPSETCRLACSKKNTYLRLAGVVKTPRILSAPHGKVFVKPDVGHASRDARLLEDGPPVRSGELMLEYLPGEEYTVDCFTDRHRRLLFASARCRRRRANGISVNTALVDGQEFQEFAERLNSTVEFRGAWFFQVKRDAEGILTLLEIATRIAGSSAIQRFRGVNLSLLAYYDYLGEDVEITLNQVGVELERSWSIKFMTDMKYSSVYVDFDDTLHRADGTLNATLIHFLVQCLNEGKRLYVVSRHQGNLEDFLNRLRIRQFFSGVFHIQGGQKKSEYISHDAIFIDDSFTERNEVAEALGIPVFSPDVIEGLLR